MRKLLTILLASTLVYSAPDIVNSQSAEARTLFEALFPRAAQRRREREVRRRQRERQALMRKRRAAGPRIRVKGPSFKTYVPMQLTAVGLSALSAPFKARETELLAKREAPDNLKTEEVAEAPPKTVEAETTGSVESVEGKPANGAPAIAPEADAVQPAAVAPAGVDTVTASAPGADANPTEIAEATSVQPNAIDDQPPQVGEPVRLSAGYEHLGSIRLQARGALGKAMVAYYRKNPDFIWSNGRGKLTENANAVLRTLAQADLYGLRLEDYALPVMAVGDDVTDDDLLRASMEFEFALTAAALRYMADAKNGIVDPNKISGYHDFKNLGVNYSRVMSSLAKAEDPSSVMLAQHPSDPSFERLRQELVKQRKAATGPEPVRIAHGTFVRPGGTSDQMENMVEAIRRKTDKAFQEKHSAVFAGSHSTGIYADETVEMVRDFQKSKGLVPDGIIGQKTIAKMKSDDPNARVNKIIYAMERLRWHPDRLGQTHVFINQPAYRATYVRNGKSRLSMRAVVGKPSNQTYFFHDEIEYVEYNPYWGVPQSILVNEMLPKLLDNPGYLDQEGYELTTLKGRQISSYNVNWWGVGRDFPYNVRQYPGPGNALGELKIMFPNSHSIYMHDTPAKSLFEKRERAFSHGCVRLADPRAMAAAVLGTDVGEIGWQISDGRNKKQQLKRKIPVYVAYFTAWPDKNGTVRFYSDVYGRDDALQKAMEMEAKTRESARNV